MVGKRTTRWGGENGFTNVEIILLLGAAPYRLDADDAAWLEQEIRKSCADESGRVFSMDEAVWSCIRLANALADDLESRWSPDPIELGLQHVEGLLTFVLDDETARRSTTPARRKAFFSVSDR